MAVNSHFHALAQQRLRTGLSMLIFHIQLDRSGHRELAGIQQAAQSKSRPAPGKNPTAGIQSIWLVLPITCDAPLIIGLRSQGVKTGYATRALVGEQNPESILSRGGLPCTIGADQPNHFTMADLKTNITYRFHRIIGGISTVCAGQRPPFRPYRHAVNLDRFST